MTNVIENCVKNEDYDLIIPYAQTTMEDLESRYCTINTGNLVIDSFVSNLLLQTKKHGITLHTNLKIDNNIIPLSDYHMTVILRNLLDNALNACLEQNDGTINLTIQTVEDTFTIHITNTYVCAPDNNALLEDIDNFDFIHGYGLKNVKTSTLYYHGVCLIDYKNDIYSVTVIIPLEC
ncbi:MAG: GHKL domain-containing protein [Lachnospiraceae bacterium]|nr:GHKL domain-containing protein [Lachnospiraceae bacterium]